MRRRVPEKSSGTRRGLRRWHIQKMVGIKADKAHTMRNADGQLECVGRVRHLDGRGVPKGHSEAEVNWRPGPTYEAMNARNL